MPDCEPERRVRRFPPGVDGATPARSPAATGLLELDLITRDLAARPGIGCALIAAESANGTAVVLSCGHPGDRTGPGPREFVSRAVRTSHALSEPIDPAQDASLCHPDSSVRCTYGVSAPIAVQGERATALCAGLAAAPAGSHANVLWVVAAYARLASLRLAKHGQPLFANGRDAVTGCLTYPAVLETLADELARCAMTDRDIACCFVSIEAIGGGEGSEFLATAGRMLLGLIGEGDCVGRYGRAQFIVVLPGSDLRGAIRMGKGIRASFESASGVDARVGVAQWVPGTGADRLLGDADRSLAAARNGRKRKEAAARA